MNSLERERTIQTYRESASALAAYFSGIGSRVEDIERAFALVGKDRPTVVEIGCGNGRDATEIIKRAGSYVGMDISEEMIDLARTDNPGANFEVADIATYAFPPQTDLVFAFAALLHSDEEEFGQALDRAYDCLNPAGIVYLSLKRGGYGPRIKEDAYGVRTFYFYEAEDIRSLAGNRFEVAYEDEYVSGHTPWLDMALRKI